MSEKQGLEAVCVDDIRFPPNILHPKVPKHTLYTAVITCTYNMQRRV